ncbi:MAG: hypothetical protein IIC28_06100 [Chloroflexi bacterium]|nr:hypothetical protein [Chloroflexota bacterium]
MSLFKFLVRFGAGVVTLLWVHVWKWSYPQSAAVVEELARKEIDLVEHGSPVWKLLRLSIDLPGIARSQQTAENSAATRTSGQIPPSEPRQSEKKWRGATREFLIWIVIAGWLAMTTSIFVSFVQTGNFLFEYAPDSGRPEIVTPYFKIVALALLAQIVSVGSGLAVLRLAK